ncbi:MAG: OmpA family protein [Prevotella sp.]|nr:OmpA family protein [Prevotella sp.]
MRKPSTIFFDIVVMIAVVMAVSACGADKHLKKGEKYLALGEYFDAATEFKKAYQTTPPKERDKRGERALKMAKCYAKINQTQAALAGYRNAIRYNQAELDDHLNYARLLLKNGEYKAAAAEFQMMKDSLTARGEWFLSREERKLTDKAILTQNGLFSAQNAPQWKEQGSRYTVKRMDLFNSRRADYSPMLLGDEYDRLYFTSTRNEANGDELSGITGTKPADIFCSEKDDKGKWSRPEVVQGGLNTDYDEGACYFSVDGREMYLTVCQTDPSSPRLAQIMKSNRTDASWSKPTEVKISSDTLSAYAHPAISPDGQWLYFCSDMPGGKGGLDIWRVRLTAGGMGGVENLGDPINTPGDEMFPTFRANGDFYFSSNGHTGFGGLDIYIAKIDPNTKRYVLEHPGYPLNTQADDFGMTFENPYNRGYFSSNRGDGRGWDHIFSFENPEIVQSIKGWVYEMDGYELTAAEVHLVGDDGTNQKLSVRSDGSFTYVVTPGVSYVLLATCKGFLNHKEELRVEQAEESEEYVLQFPLASITAPVLIDNIFYDFDKATLRPESTKALDELVKLLNENPNVTIELSAHCDFKGPAAYNKRLSQRRAESVVAYLIDHGIAADRLTPVGYGKEKPKKVNKKVVSKHKFLKEGDVLTEEFILNLGEKEQEACNQLNRRTEFTVLRTTYGMFDEKGQLKELPKPKKQEQPLEEDDFDFYIEE